MNIEEQLLDCIGMVLRVDVDKLKNYSKESPLNAIGMDSLNSIDIIVSIEQEFDINFIEEELLIENINTIKKLNTFVEQKLEIRKSA